MMECPSCRGGREMVVLACGQRSDGDRFSQETRMPCSTCRGIGEVDDQYAERRAWGQRVRHIRVFDRSETQRQAGEALRIDFARFSRIENGVEAPTAAERERIERHYGLAS